MRVLSFITVHTYYNIRTKVTLNILQSMSKCQIIMIPIGYYIIMATVSCVMIVCSLLVFIECFVESDMKSDDIEEEQLA